MKVGILNIGEGNIFSISSTIKKIGFEIISISNPLELKKVNCLIMPGVGAFKAYMNALNKNKFPFYLREFISKKDNRLIGICIGMQVLFENSEENKNVEGLKLFSGNIRKNIGGLNIGYKQIIKNPKSTSIYSSKYLDKKEFFFTHGFYADTKFKFDEIYYTKSGKYEYCSFIRYKNIYGCQFHPELSGVDGIGLLKFIINN